MKNNNNIMVVESVDENTFTLLVEDAIRNHGMEIADTKIVEKGSHRTPYYTAILTKKKELSEKAVSEIGALVELILGKCR